MSVSEYIINLFQRRPRRTAAAPTPAPASLAAIHGCSAQWVVVVRRVVKDEAVRARAARLVRLLGEDVLDVPRAPAQVGNREIYSEAQTTGSITPGCSNAEIL